MLPNRFTVLVDACALVPVLSRNLLLSLAEAELFRLHWSSLILDEAERAVAGVLAKRDPDDAVARARRARAGMERAFPEAIVTGYDMLAVGLMDLPDPHDAHVVAAALRAGASLIVTDNLKHFAHQSLAPLSLEAKSADDFVADTIDLDQGRAVAAVRTVRERLKRPLIVPDDLLLTMEARGPRATADALRPYLLLL